MITLMLLYMFYHGVLADEAKPSSIELYKGAQELVNDVGGIISNKEQLKKIESDEKFERKIEGIEKLERSNRDLSIKSFEDYVKDYPDSPYVPDALYRLSKLYYEKASQTVIKDTENYEKEYQKFLRGEAQVLPPEPVADYSKAIRTLNRLISDHKTYKYRDEAMYLSGYVYFEQGNVKKGIRSYETLIKEYPKSNKLAEVYTRLGEYYFDSGDLSKAVYYYSQALEYPDSQYYENVLYKLAWTYYHKKKIEEASGFFVSLIDYDEKKFGKGYSGATVNEAKNYIAIGYAESRQGIKRAYDFFGRIGGRSYEYEVMKRILYIYCGSDRINEAVDSFNFIIAHYPYHQENPVIDEKLLNSIKADQTPRLLNRERDRMIQLFGEGSIWREKNKDNPEAVTTAEEIIKKQLIMAAVYHHKKGDERKDRKEYIKAAKLYYEFLSKYPMDGLVAGARYNYAKVLFNLKDYRGAIKEYTAVQDYTDDEKLKEESSFSIIAAWHDRLKREDPKKYSSKEIKPLLAGEKLLPRNNLDEKELATIDACKKYERINPKGQRLALVWYVEAEIYFRNNMFSESRGKYGLIIEKYPSDSIASDSMRNIIASYAHEKNYTEVEEWSKKLLASRMADKNAIGDDREIKNLMTGSVFSSAKSMEEEGRYEEAASEYIRLSKQYPRSEYSDAAMYNAGLIYEKTGNSAKAISIYEMMLAKYPKSKNSTGAMFRTAVSYEKQLYLGNALRLYDHIIKKYPNTAFAADSNYSAGRIRRAYGQYDKAADHFMSYSSGSHEQTERSSSLMLSASLYEMSAKYTKALKAYERYIEDNKKDIDGACKAHIGKARIYEKLNKKDLARAEYKSVTNSFKAYGSPSGTKAAEYNAEALFKTVNDISAQYRAINKKGVFGSMKTAYEKKQTLLQEISRRYLEVIELGSPEWSVASLYMMGIEFQNFADFLYSTPAPKEINTEQLKLEYKSQVQAQVMPYEDKAIEYYEKCIAESARLKVANEWTKKSTHKLAQLKPGQYQDSSDEITMVYPSIEIKDQGFVGR
jgi:TolA-binding protein